VFAKIAARAFSGNFMKKDSFTISSRLWQVVKRVGLVKCSSEKHQWEFFDNFPGHEIYECRVYKQKKFLDLKTGKETYGYGK
jgi:hypothetical protein